jgi:FkbM family methyltransferase
MDLGRNFLTRSDVVIWVSYMVYRQLPINHIEGYSFCLVYKYFVNQSRLEIIMYSQNNEESVIVNFFGDRIGTFLDIGAYEGKTFSNTYALVEKRWSGVAIEASPINFSGLMKNLKDKPVELICAAIAKTSELLTFWDSQGDAISSSDTEHVKKWSKHCKNYQKIFVQSITLETVFSKFGSNFDFINIDVEGYSVDLLFELDFSQLPAKCVCVEIDGDKNMIISHMQNYGFGNIVQCGAENLIFMR